MEITYEQKLIIDTPLEAFNVMKITAFAGTGKSTTLREYAKKYPEKRFLYIVFNKIAATEAKSKFPANCDCRTIHSLAYGIQKNWIDKKKNGISNRMRGILSNEYLLKLTQERDKVITTIISQTIRKYCQLTDIELSSAHVPPETLSRIEKRMKVKTKEGLQIAVDSVVKSAKHVLDVCMSDVPGELTYDLYLKRLLLVEHSIPRYDAIMLDEAQDSDPVTIELLRKSGIKLILVGDPHQQIYSFRKAINAMQAFKADREYSLTGSFRFGKDIASKANAVLAKYKGESRKIKGLASENADEKSDSTCYIARTNAGLFKKIIELGDKPYQIQGGVDVVELHKILDIYYLWAGKKDLITSEEILDFEKFEEMKNYGEETDDIIIERYCGFIEDYKERIPAIIDRIKNSISRVAFNSNTVITTCHKAKGNEYDHVILIDDFKVPLKHGLRSNGVAARTDDEINILYVALTRAKKTLIIPDRIIKAIEFFPEEHVVISGNDKIYEIVNNMKTNRAEETIDRSKEYEDSFEYDRHALSRIAATRFLDGELGLEEWSTEDRLYNYIKYFDDARDSYEYIDSDPNYDQISDWSDTLDDLDSEYWEFYCDPGSEFTDRQ